MHHRVIVAYAIILAGFALTASVQTAASESTSTRESARLRYPIALSVGDDGQRAFTANRKSGSVSIVDFAAGEVVAEYDVARQIADMAATPDGRHMLVVDDADGKLVLLAIDGDKIDAVARLDVAGAPVTVVVAPDGSRCAVASLWARRITMVELLFDEDDSHAKPALFVAGRIDLPFAPREQIFTPDGSRLIVAGSFRAQLAVIDTAEHRLIGDCMFDGHNIRGMALARSGEELLVAYQILKGELGTTRENVLWADLMRNVVRRIPLAPLVDESSERRVAGHPKDLGTLGNAGGDPAAVVEDSDNSLIVALAGVDQIALVRNYQWGVPRVSVGRRPTDLALLPGGMKALVANSFDDTLSVVDLLASKVERVIPLGPMRSPTPAELGEQLFYDARLSLHGWYSCHSCHTDGHANGRLNDNKSDGSFGAPKRVLSLLGVRDSAPWAWLANVEQLEDQIHRSTESTMIGHPLDDGQAAALLAYLETLDPPPPRGEFQAPADANAVARGELLFKKHQCHTCHAPPNYTSAEIYDVGLTDAVGNRKFNPPSLRGVSQRTPLFHDGSAASLEDVFSEHRHPRGLELTATERADLLTFLRGL